MAFLQKYPSALQLFRVLYSYLFLELKRHAVFHTSNQRLFSLYTHLAAMNYHLLSLVKEVLMNLTGCYNVSLLPKEGSVSLRLMK